MKIRILFLSFYLTSISAYLFLSRDSIVRWNNVFVSVVGVIAVFVFIGRFVRKRATPRAVKIFRGVLIVIHVLYVVMIVLSFMRNWYANACFGIVFIAPMSALLIECFFSENGKNRERDQGEETSPRGAEGGGNFEESNP